MKECGSVVILSGAKNLNLGYEIGSNKLRFAGKQGESNISLKRIAVDSDDLRLYGVSVSAWQSISSHTQFCAVIGNPIAHSLSPAIHNAAFQSLGLDFIYLAFRVEDVKGTLAGVRALDNFRGLSVTIPHKIEAMKYVDEIADVDRSIGAINTVIHEKDKLIGLGTDGPGALKALADAGVEADGKNVLMLGSGGAARAIAFTLARNTKLSELSILDINEKMLQELSADLQSGTDAAVKAALLTDKSLAAAVASADLIIHCTPVGMYPNEDASLVPAELLRPEQVVFDIVYTPLETQLLANARSRGCAVIPGVEMFINQAALQFEHFTGVDAPVEVMRRVVMEHLQS
ncbi:MAG: shikimate dehydrogenase [Armatimonadetes bacterium]|nr:shikimate dehydrogenase [Armatimonadota bacterium]NIM23500.1 shikimate dehydrogenase [Armatimonadota bacterium]NIM67366.1 shikimate dehydrogenase [Armatimonadota bacterium]NIM75867.1 shikimate dehydrogenase [Armatimonadota bacterium]NIN05552.1 shikimate dehydrogenase [Armatimonadota bacterium]